MFRSCFNPVKSIARSVSVSLPFLGCTSAEIVLLQPRTVLADGLRPSGINSAAALCSSFIPLALFGILSLW